jgi:hypothetical protein
MLLGWRSGWILLAASTPACASSAPDVPGPSDAGTACQAVSGCEVDLAADQLHPEAELPGCCARQLWPDHPSAGLYGVCAVGPDARTYLTVLSGSTIIDTPDWTHSWYGNGNIPSTLSAADEQRCAAAFQIRYEDSVSDASVCPGLIGQ